MMNFLMTAGADPYAHLKQNLTQVPAPVFEGVWATVELQPNIFSRQRYCIGVAVAGHDGSITFQLLEDLAKFDCLFGRDYVSQLSELIESAEQTLLRTQLVKKGLQGLQFDSDSIFLGDLWPTAGSSASAVVQRLFLEVVPFIPATEKRVREFVPMDNATVRQLVNDELRRISGLAFERISCSALRSVTDAESGGTHQLEFNLETDAKAGNVISAVYKTPDRVELNFLRASRDLSTYSQLRHKSQLALFVMVPSSGAMPHTDRLRIENVLDEQSWNLEKQGFMVSMHEKAPELAADILEWSELSTS
jgi:hypothetical protein